MEDIIELANKIADPELRRKVIEILKNPTLSSKDFKKHKPMDFNKVSSIFTIDQSPALRPLKLHVKALAEICLSVADVLERNYGIKVSKDELLASALLHDLMKIYEYKLEKGELMPTDCLLDHTMLAVSELYARNFPERLIHMIASHFGEHGPTPPRTLEALLFHQLDSMLAWVEHYLFRIQRSG